MKLTKEQHNLYGDAWCFLENFLPNYYHRDDVLVSDILYRFITDDDVSDDDLEWIENEFASNKENVAKYLQKLDSNFFDEATRNFYSQIINDNR